MEPEIALPLQKDAVYRAALKDEAHPDGPEVQIEVRLGGYGPSIMLLDADGVPNGGVALDYFGGRVRGLVYPVDPHADPEPHRIDIAVSSVRATPTA